MKYQGLCRDCSMFIRDTERCTIHGPNDVIRPGGTCEYFKRGKSVTSKTAHPTGKVTKKESEYRDNAAALHILVIQHG